MNVLDLFSGIGGFSLGLERAGMRTVAFCEIEPYCRSVLRKHWPEVPCYEDVRTVTADRLRADGISVDLIAGGFPCQPFSHAGKRLGAEDDRHLWPQMRRLVAELRPAWFIGENVTGIINMELDAVLSDLATLAYTSGTFVIPAVAVDAPHRRDRVWIVACDTNGDGKSDGTEHAEMEIMRGAHEGWTFADAGSGHRVGTGSAIPARRATADARDPRVVANANGARSQGRHQHAERTGERLVGQSGSERIWPTFDAVAGGMDDGLPGRVHRLKALGNAVVPQIPEVIGRAIMEAACGRV